MDEVKIGLLGETLKHSYSKIIHEETFNVSYNLYEVPLDKFDEFMRKKDFLGINVTIPYKEKVVPYLDFISEKAKKIGAVNTIVNKSGKLYGYNTDYDGFKYLLKKNNFKVNNSRCLILGSGGTSKTVKNVLTDLNSKEISIASRNKSENTLLYKDVNYNNYDYIINTTPVGMFPNISESIIDKKLDSLKGLIDVIYNPLRTRWHLINPNIKYSSGLLMLVYQALASHNLFFSINEEVNEEKVNEVYKKLKRKVQNIVLIGMPGSGKTTISIALSEKLNIPYIDTDEAIVKKSGKEIEEIFLEFGQKKFRDLETEVIKDVSKENGKIISTGGGVILNKENIDLLKANGVIIYLKKDVDKILSSFNYNRPLAKTKEELEKLYEERKNLYIEYADVIVENNDINEALEEILKVI